MIYPLPTCSPSITRTMEATFLNTVANHPDVRPYLGGEGVLDLSHVVGDPQNVALVTDCGGYVGVNAGAGRYEVHSIFTPAHGPAAIQAMREACDYIFTATDAQELVTKMPTDNLPAKALAKLAGFQSVFTGRVPWVAGTDALSTFASLTVDRWAVHSARCASLGVWLHEAMEDAKVRWQSALGTHSDDDEDVHHHMAGAAVLMLRQGNVLKAVTFYNHYAQWALFPPIVLLHAQPVIVDLGGGMIATSRLEGLEILSCP